jgi:type 1 glutamine amidotransferase
MLRRTSLLLFLAGAIALPVQSAKASEPKKVIVVTTTAGFRHSSIPFAEKTIAELGEKSGAFKVVDYCQQPDVTVPKKPNKPKDLAADADDKAKAKYAKDMAYYDAQMAKWTPEVEAQAKAAQAELDTKMAEALVKLSPDNLKAKGIDAVIFANTTGDLPLPDKEGFIKWIEDGHAFIGMHSSSDTFHKFEGYLDLLQGEFAGHGAQVPADLVAADKKHPANAEIGDSWNLKQEEMYLIKHHDRSKVRSLWHLRQHPNKPEEKGYFPVSWVRTPGKGKVFYTSLGHREDLWSADPELKGRVNPVETAKQYQAHILGGIKWALGRADGSAEPNPTVE